MATLKKEIIRVCSSTRLFVKNCYKNMNLSTCPIWIIVNCLDVLSCLKYLQLILMSWSAEWEHHFDYIHIRPYQEVCLMAVRSDINQELNEGQSSLNLISYAVCPVRREWFSIQNHHISILSHRGMHYGEVSIISSNVMTWDNSVFADWIVPSSCAN